MPCLVKKIIFKYTFLQPVNVNRLLVWLKSFSVNSPTFLVQTRRGKRMKTSKYFIHQISHSVEKLSDMNNASWCSRRSHIWCTRPWTKGKKNRSNEKTAVQTSGQVSKEVFLVLFDLIHIFMENLLHSLSPVEEIFLNGDLVFAFQWCWAFVRLWDGKHICT